MSLGLLGAYDSGSDTESDSDQDTADQDTVEHHSDPEPETTETLENPFGSASAAAVLPKPSFMQEQQEKVSGLKFDNSVFSNPFRDKEDKKKAILEQHVNMTQRQEEMRIIDGKKVCWMYRKGRCRQGSRCQFAHDNDVKTDKVREAKYDAESQISNDKSSKGAAHPIRLLSTDGDLPQVEEEETFVRKKRPGLSQGLVPSKKAMQFHKKVYNQ